MENVQHYMTLIQFLDYILVHSFLPCESAGNILLMHIKHSDILNSRFHSYITN